MFYLLRSLRVDLFIHLTMMLTSAASRTVKITANIQKVTITEDARMLEIAAHVGSRS